MVDMEADTISFRMQWQKYTRVAARQAPMLLESWVHKTSHLLPLPQKHAIPKIRV